MRIRNLETNHNPRLPRRTWRSIRKRAWVLAYQAYLDYCSQMLDEIESERLDANSVHIWSPTTFVEEV